MTRRLMVSATVCSVVLLLLLCWAVPSLSEHREVNVHIIPHSHCDPGWLTTFEGYYNERVQYILDAVLEELEKDPSRTFVWAEISFFSRWYDVQGEAKRNRLKKLIESKQFEFVAGGWVQNDEANANYDIVIDQITEGHEYILKHFNVRPRVAWQIDPFGHSSLTPSIFAQMGYDALVINRIHHNTKNIFKSAKHMEFIWRGSHSLKDRSDMFTHVLHSHYSAPQGYDWEEGSQHIDDHNVRHRADQLARMLRERANSYPTGHLLVTFGDDFKFRNARVQFENMDKLIKHINGRDELKMKINYSTPERYFDAVHEFAVQEQTKFPLYVGDFFPYADNEDSYWTGYYTTKPKIKWESRHTDGVLRAAEIAYALARIYSRAIDSARDWVGEFAMLQQGRRDASLVQHHDGITGTAKGFVADDYLTRLATAVKNSLAILTRSIPVLIRKDSSDTPQLRSDFKIFELQADSAAYPIVVFNSLPWPRTEFVSVRVKCKDAKAYVMDGEGNNVPAELSPILDGQNVKQDEFNLFFRAQVPPVGTAMYWVANQPHGPQPAASVAKVIVNDNLNGAPASELYLQTSQYKIELSPQSGLINKIENNLAGISTKAYQQLMKYSTSNSGAYIMRTTGPAAAYAPGNTRVTVIRGKLVQQSISTISGRSLVMTVFDDSNVPAVMEQRWTVSADPNEEVVTRYETDIETNNVWYTDNGIEMVPRKLRKNDASPHKNYYPTLSTAFIKDKYQQFTILTTNAMGATSLRDGQLEMMMHRHLTRDDGRGLGEPNNDRSVVDLTTWILYDEPEVSTEVRRTLSLALNNPLQILHGENDPLRLWSESYLTTYSALKEAFPENVHLLSLKARHADSKEVILRIMHIHESDESSVLSKPIRVEVDSLFDQSLSLSTQQETSLSLHQGIEAKQSTRKKWVSSGISDLSSVEATAFSLDKQNTDEAGVYISKDALDKAREGQTRSTGRSTLAIESGLQVGLDPTQIRSFLVELSGEQPRLAKMPNFFDLPSVRNQGISVTPAQLTRGNGQIYNSMPIELGHKPRKPSQKDDKGVHKKTEIGSYEFRGMIFMYAAGFCLLVVIYLALKRGSAVRAGRRRGATPLESVTIEANSKRL